MSVTDESPAVQPEVLGGVVPYLCIDGAAQAADFYTRAFGAREVARQPADEQGRTMHIHLYLNGGSLMLADPFPDYGHPWQPHQGYTLHLKVDDLDAWWQRAVNAGAEVVVPVALQFWGDRYGQLRDPFGVNWSLAQPGSDTKTR